VGPEELCATLVSPVAGAAGRGRAVVTARNMAGEGPAGPEVQLAWDACPAAVVVSGLADAATLSGEATSPQVRGRWGKMARQ
jgi:hypothetical protein